MLGLVHLLLAAVLCQCKVQVSPPEVATLASIPEPLVDGLSVHAFLDDNGYIRLNITWGDVLCDAEYVSVSFTGGEECNPISDVDSYALHNHFLIRPSMELERPADHIIHGCVYNVTLQEKTALRRSQSLVYRVPDCVENKCQCRNETDSPNKLAGIVPLSDHRFLLSWNKTTDGNVTVQYIYYQRKDVKDSTKTYVPEKVLKYRNNSVELPLHDLKEDVVYTVNVIFIDEFNECLYASSLDYINSSQSHVFLFVVSVVLVVVFVLVMYKLSMCSPRVRGKLQKYFHLPKSYAAVDLNLALPLNQPCKLREEINAQYTPLEFVLQVHKYDKFEFPRNKILTSSVIGQGAFGKVLCGKAYEIASKPGFTNVAVKQLRDGATEEEVLDFQAEIDMLKRIGTHENVVRLLGCVTMDQPYLMVMELVTGGSLKDYLLNLRRKWTERQTPRIFFPDDMDEEWIKSNHERPNGKVSYISCVFDTSDSSYIVPTTPISADSSVFLKTELGPKQKNAEAPKNPHTPTSMVSSRLPSSTETEFTNLDLESPTPLVAEVSRPPEPVLDHTELQRFAFQIASGMLCLEKMCVTHRDLAARNILITSDKVLKISDFGMSRSGAYVNRTSKKVPLRWMAIESIEDQKWDGKSDVWSFGVVLWEIGTLGAFPYEHTRDVLLLPELKSGKRLERPKVCTDELYALMLRCWSADPGERPSFKELVELLDVKKRKVYVDFSQISPKYVFPPTRDLEKRVVSV